MPKSIDPVGRHLHVKKIFAYMLCHPVVSWLLRIVYNNRIPHLGSRIELPSCASGGSGAASLFWGLYESAEIRFINRYLDGSVDVVELGSSVGGVSCVIAKKLHHGRKLICVEANPNIIDLLKRNLTNNAHSKEVKVIHGAICYEGSSQVEFIIGSDHLSSHLVSAGKNTSTARVSAVRLSEILEQEAIRKYCLVCDIEGAEIQLFVHDSTAIRNCKTLIIELHHAEYNQTLYDPESIIDMIKENTHLTLVSRYGNVCVFDSPTTQTRENNEAE